MEMSHYLWAKIKLASRIEEQQLLLLCLLCSICEPFHLELYAFNKYLVSTICNALSAYADYFKVDEEECTSVSSES